MKVHQPNGDTEFLVKKKNQFGTICTLNHGSVKVTLVCFFFAVCLQKLEKSNLDNWENIRGPSLWEDSRTVQKQRREALRLRTE